MKITRNIILDLLPLYIANEASEDTNALVKEYLKTDPELADIAEKSTASELPGNAPSPLKKEDKMEAYKEAKRILLQRTIIIAAIISASVLVIAILAILLIFFFRG